MQDIQRTFHVTKDGDTFTMDSDMSDDDLMQLYEEAKDGRLIVNKPDGTVTAQNGSGMFLTVGADGMPVFCDLAFDSVKSLGAERIAEFYRKNPQLLDQSMNDDKTLAEVCAQMTT